ncbi:MAG: DUF1858 domain-containing protein [Candidatus Aenigmatarchaeota archaeon]
MKKNVSVKKLKISKKMILGDVIAKYPDVAEIFFNHGLPCAMCQMASGETIEEAAESHGVSLDKLLKDLNKVADKK